MKNENYKGNNEAKKKIEELIKNKNKEDKDELRLYKLDLQNLNELRKIQKDFSDKITKELEVDKELNDYLKTFILGGVNLIIPALKDIVNIIKEYSNYKQEKDFLEKSLELEKKLLDNKLLETVATVATKEDIKKLEDIEKPLSYLKENTDKKGNVVSLDNNKNKALNVVVIVSTIEKYKTDLAAKAIYQKSNSLKQKLDNFDLLEDKQANEIKNKILELEDKSNKKDNNKIENKEDKKDFKNKNKNKRKR